MVDTMAQYELSLRDYWRVIRRRRWIIVLIFLAIFFPTIFYAYSQRPVYQAEAQVRITERKTFGGVWTEAFISPIGDPMLIQAELITSREVAIRAAKILGFVPADKESYTDTENRIISDIQDSVSASIKPNTDIIKIVVTHSDPLTPCLYADAIAEAFDRYSLDKKIQEAAEVLRIISSKKSETGKLLEKDEAELRVLKTKGIEAAINQLDQLEKERLNLLITYTEKHPQVVRLDEEIKALRAKVTPDDEAKYRRLNREIKANEPLYDQLLKEEQQATKEATKVSDVTILNKAKDTGAVPIRSKKDMQVMVGLIIGLMLGLASAFVVEHLDTSIGTIEEIEEILKLPVLGVIPYLSPPSHSESSSGLVKKEPHEPRQNANDEKLSVSSDTVVSTSPMRGEDLRKQLLWNYSPLSPIVESYRILRTNVIKYSNHSPDSPGDSPAEKVSRVVLVTSAGPDEGKTITTLNLALTMAQKGERVLLIDADMRRSIIHRVFGIDKSPGLSELLMRRYSIDETIRRITDVLISGILYETILQVPWVDNLSIITAGGSVPHPSELIDSDEAKEVFKALREQYNYIIIDCPPVLPVTDALILGSLADMVVLVYRAGKTAKHALLRARDQLQNAHIPVKGVILNYQRPELEITPAYYYHYYRKYQ